MSQRDSRISQPSKTPPQTQDTSRVNYNPFTLKLNHSSSNFTPHKNVYFSALSTNRSTSNKRLSSADVLRLTGSQFKQGQVVRGKSKMSYVPYQKKIVDYQMRTHKQLVPKKKKVIQYKQQKVISTVPRQVIRQQYYPVQKITQYYKQIIDVKPVQKKIKRLQYVPVSKQIVHYPGSQSYQNIKSQSRLHLQNKGFTMKQDAQYVPIRQDVLYQYGSIPSNLTVSKKLFESSSKRLISKSPAPINSNLCSSRVQVFNPINQSSIGNLNMSRYKMQRVQDRLNQENLRKSLSKSNLLSRYGSTGNLTSAVYL